MHELTPRTDIDPQKAAEMKIVLKGVVDSLTQDLEDTGNRQAWEALQRMRPYLEQVSEAAQGES